MEPTVSLNILIAIVSGIVIPMSAGFLGMFLKMNGVGAEVKTIRSVMDLQFTAVGHQVANVQGLMLQRVEQNEESVKELRKDKHNDRVQMLAMEQNLKERIEASESKVLTHVGNEHDKVWRELRDQKEYCQRTYMSEPTCRALHTKLERGS